MARQGARLRHQDHAQDHRPQKMEKHVRDEAEMLLETYKTALGLA
jgi:uncharacterized protein (UPF0335 family)